MGDDPRREAIARYVAVVGLMILGRLWRRAVIPAEARDLERKGDLSGATSLYREALQKDPDNVEILAALAADLTPTG